MRATLTRGIDRWIYVFMAALVLVTTLTGFVPDSIEKMAAVESGQRPPFPPVLHVHAVLMGSWLMLLLVRWAALKNHPVNFGYVWGRTDQDSMNASNS